MQNAQNPQAISGEPSDIAKMPIRQLLDLVSAHSKRTEEIGKHVPRSPVKLSDMKGLK